MLESLKRMVAPVTLSQGLKIACRMSGGKNRVVKNSHYYHPVRRLMEFIGLRRAEDPERLTRKQLIRLGDIPVREVDEQLVYDWYQWLRTVKPRTKGSKRLAPSTINSYARMVRAYFGHLQAAAHIGVNPATALKIMRPPRKEKKAIPPDAIERMIQHARPWRDLAIVLMLADTGCRVGELVSMQVATVMIRPRPEDPDSAARFYPVDEFTLKGQMRPLEGKATVYGKTGDRWVYFGDRAARTLVRYVEYRPVRSGPVLWLTETSHTPLRRDSVYSMLRRVAELAGVERFNPHAFRHAFAKRLLDAGASVKYVQELMGHGNIQTTMEYLQLDDDDLNRYHRLYRND